MSTTDDRPAEVLTRDQLISALDKEITDTAAAQASTGRTKWNLLLALAALIGLALQSWETAKFSPYRLVALCLAMCAAWDLTRVLLGQLDASPDPGPQRHNKFFRFSDLFGTFRSTLLAYAIREGLIVAGAFWLAAPEVWLFKWFSAKMLFSVVAGFFASYTAFPIGSGMTGARFPILGWRLLSLVWNVAGVGGVLLLVWKLRWQFTPSDVKLAAIITAASIVVIWLAEEIIPESRLQQLRRIRHNLAFARTSLEDARNQTDFLLVGIGIAQLLGRPFEELSQAIESARASLNPVESNIPEYTQLGSDLIESKGHIRSDHPEYQEFTRLHLLMRDLLAGAGASCRRLQKQSEKFKGKCALLAFFNPETKKDAGPFLQKLDEAIAPIAKRLTELEAVAHQYEPLLSKGPPILPP